MMWRVDDRDAVHPEHRASLLRARLSAILDTTLDPLLLARPTYDAAGRVTDFVIADMNAPHTRAGGDPAATPMRLQERSPELFAMYCRVLETGTTESVRRVWIRPRPDDPSSASGWADVRASAVAGDLVVSWRNVDADVAAEHVLRLQALQDPLTQLPNRRGLMESLMGALAAPAPFGVLFLDIDDFKSINDRHGHAVGDAVLRATGRRLAGVLRGEDVVGRLAGDEFVVVARRLRTPDDLRALALRLLATGEDRYGTGADAVHLTVSVGALWVASEGDDIGEILGAADRLMYAAKRHGGAQLRIGFLGD